MGMEWFNIITGIAGVCGALSWIPIVQDKMKKREVRASLIHCRFFDQFSIPKLPPDHLNQIKTNPNVTFDRYEGSLIVVGINICSVNKDFIIEHVKTTIKMDKSEHEAILVSPDVPVNYISSQDQTLVARLSIPSHLDATKMKNIKADVNTRLYMAFVCKDIKELKYANFNSLNIEFIDVNGKKFLFAVDKPQIDKASLICDRDIYDVDYLAKIGQRKMMEYLPNSPMFMQKIQGTTYKQKTKGKK